MFKISLDYRQSLGLPVLTVIFLIALVSAIFAQTKYDVIQPLNSERTITRQLEGAEKHRYQIAAQSEELVQITIERKEVDITSEVFDKDGKSVVVKSERKSIGEPEVLSFVAAAGKYILEIRSADRRARQKIYTVSRAKFRKATAEDGSKTGAKGTAAGNAAGSWTIVVTTKQGDLQFTMVVQQENDKLSGLVQSIYGDGIIKDGVIEGNQVNLTVTSQILEARLKGELADDKMKGTITSSIPNAGELRFVGTRSN